MGRQGCPRGNAQSHRRARSSLGHLTGWWVYCREGVGCVMGCIIGRVFGVVRGLLLGVWNQRAGQDYTVCAIYLCMSVCVSVIYDTGHVCIYS